MQKAMSSANEFSHLKAGEYRLSFTRIKGVCRQFSLAIMILFLILSYSVTISGYFHVLWLEILLAAADLLWIASLCIRLKKEKSFLLFDKCQLDEAALLLMRNDIFRFYKQLSDVIFFIIPTLIIMVYTVMSFALQSTEMEKEVSYQIAVFYACILLVLISLLINTSLTLYCGRPYLSAAQKREIDKTLCKIASVCLGYWLLVSAFLLRIPDRSRSRVLCIFFLAVYLVVGLAVNLVRSKYTFHLVSKRTVIFLAVSLLALLGIRLMYTEPNYLSDYISTVSPVGLATNSISYNDEKGTFVMTTEKEKYRILQLSDIHLGGSLFSKEHDLQALDACRRLILDTKPDFIVVTGDMVFSVGIQTLSFNNRSQVAAFCDFMERIGIPWAFTYGNHDTEFLSLASKAEIDRLYLSRSYINNGLLLYPDSKPAVSGRCNQCIEIRNTDGSLRQAVFLLDSNAFIGFRANTYDGVHPDQVDWYARQVDALTKREGSLPASVLFTHIPLHEFKTAYDLYNQGSELVTFCTGKLPEGMLGNGITCQPESCKLFDAIVEKGSTQAVFCGHDHFTTLDMIYQGIRLSYGLSIDYITRPTMVKNSYQRGGTVIDILSDTSYTASRRLLADIQ